MSRSWGKAVGVLVAALLAGSMLAACGSSSTGTTTTGKAVQGGAVTVAYLPGTQPVYIFPMFPGQDDTCEEIFWFVEQFWRPLYWFGEGASLSYNPALSLAEPPVFSKDRRTVTITLKDWKWSDGTPITTRDVQFWMNLLISEKDNYANYVPGQIPDNIAGISYANKTTFSITFKQAYNSVWLLENQLSLLFAIPQHAWDKTSVTGPIGNYDLTSAGAEAVYKFLNAQSSTLSTYATNPLWQVVDGPFRLSSYQPNSEVTMVPNKNYSGPDKPKLSKVQFLNFTSDSAEYNELLSGMLDYGYVPFNDVPSESRVTSEGYSIVPWGQAGMNYAVYNFSNPAKAPLFDQLYIRQALQHLVDQAGMIKSALYGAGVPDYGPIPPYNPQPTSPSGQLLTDSTERSNPYPFSIKDATTILKAHGWSIDVNGADTCVKPGTGPNECGAGITSGEQLSFSFEYPTGVIQDQIEAQLLASDASEAGVRITQKPVPTAVVNGVVVCTSGSPCNWESAYYYLGGWQYGVPINYPVGTVIFGCGGDYLGGYCSPRLDTLMQTAEKSANVSTLYPYEDFLNQNVPVMWLPLQPYQFSAISNKLHGATPQNMGYWITPEYWYLTN
ncbi:MAG: ABC transporter substrate-binding protein [Acidimicrobiales bacterium]|jgi:peptide/nickel transport system substrate-binding protein